MTGQELNQLAAQLTIAAATLQHGQVADANRTAVDSFFEIRDLLLQEFEAKKRKKMTPAPTAAALPIAPPPVPAVPRQDPPRPPIHPRADASRHDRSSPLRRGR